MEDLRAFFSQFSSLNSRLDRLEEFRDRTERQLSTIEQRIQAIYPALTTLEQEIGSTQSQARDAITSIRQNIDELNNIVAQTNGIANQANMTVQRLQGDTTRALATMETLDARMMDTSQKATQAEQRVTEALQVATQAKTEVSQAKTEIQTQIQTAVANAMTDAQAQIDTRLPQLIQEKINQANIPALIDQATFTLRRSVNEIPIVVEDKIRSYDIPGKIQASIDRSLGTVQQEINTIPQKINIAIQDLQLKDLVDAALVQPLANIDTFVTYTKGRLDAFNQDIQDQLIGNPSKEIPSIRDRIQKAITDANIPQIIINNLDVPLKEIWATLGPIKSWLDQADAGVTEAKDKILNRLKVLTDVLVAYGAGFVDDLRTAVQWVKDKGTKVWNDIQDAIGNIGRTWNTSMSQLQAVFQMLNDGCLSVKDQFLTAADGLVSDAQIVFDWVKVLDRDKLNFALLGFNTANSIMALNYALSNLKWRFGLIKQSFMYLLNNAAQSFNIVVGLPFYAIQNFFDAQAKDEKTALSAEPQAIALLPVAKISKPAVIIAQEKTYMTQQEAEVRWNTLLQNTSMP